MLAKLFLKIAGILHFQCTFKQMLVKYNKIPHFVCAFPPKYDKLSDRFLVPKLCGRRIILLIALLLTTVDLTYLWLIAAPNVTRKTVQVRQFLDFYLHSTSRTFGCMLGWQFFFQMEKCINVLNLMFHLEHVFERMYKILFQINFKYLIEIYILL